MDERITEKVYCYNHPDSYQRSGDFATTAALMNNNNAWNNPMMYLVWLAVLGGGFGGCGRGTCGCDVNAIQGRLNSLQSTMDTNHNNDLAMNAINGNTSAIRELQGVMNIDFNTLSTALCNVKNAITEVGGRVDYSAERVINAANLGDCNIIQALKDCCCQNKELVLTQGFQNQLAQKDTLNAMGQQTYSINERLTGIANGLQKGFSDLGFLLAQNKGEMINSINAAQQRTSDLLNSHWSAELSQSLQDEKFKNSQLQQNIYFRDLIEKKSGCGCI